MTTSTTHRFSEPLPRKFLLIGIALVVLVGTWLRGHTFTESKGIGFDENYYRLYLTMLQAEGLTGFPKLIQSYSAAQQEMPAAVIPPTRVVYLGSAYLWQRISSEAPLAALHDVSTLFTILSLLVTAVFVTRMSGPGIGLAVTALMAVAPLQVQMAQRVYIDGVFAFWALLTLWLLWETLQAPPRKAWLIAYGASMACMVLTKENAAFVFIAILAILGLNRWLQFGQVTRYHLLATFLGAAAGGLLLILAAGGPQPLLQAFQLNVQKSYAIEYVVKTGDGPWFRYVLDLLTMSPGVTLLAIAAYLHPRAEDRPRLYFALFITVSFLLMANVKYGMNLRYATIWDMPLRWLAVAQLVALSALLPRRVAPFFVPTAVICLCALELRQFDLFFVQHRMYDPVPEPMLRILQILK